MRVAEVADPGQEWDDFATATPGGTLAHAAGWAHVIHQAYGLKPCYLEARDDAGHLTGILPMVRFRGLRGGLELVSMPFLDTGGILATDADAEQALLDAALERTRVLGARALELRSLGAGEPDPGEHGRVDLVLTLQEDEEAQWQAVRAKVRNQTRKADKEGLVIADDSGPALLDAFYAPFCQNMRDLGSPVHARRFFAASADVFGDRLRFVVTRLGERPVGGLVAIQFGETVSVPWASTLRAERRRCPNNQIYWEALRWAVARGAKEFDFGRSPRGAGTHRFKVGWGARERPLAWSRRDAGGAELPWQSASDSGVLQRLSAVWSRLPVPLTAVVGPWLRGRISS